MQDYDFKFLSSVYNYVQNLKSISVISHIGILIEYFNLPVLSAQLITAPTGKPNDILNLAPAEPPRPKI
jgi:hypothetical protein